MLVTHPRLASTYAVGLFGMGITYITFDDYRHKNRLGIQHTHDKYMMETNHTHEKYMMETNHTHDKYMLHNSWWYQLKRIFS
jgi:hypothetical protein